MVERKVPGGKLLRLKVECDRNVIIKMKVEGDFFLYPEDGLPLIEGCLIGMRVDEPEMLRERLRSVIEENVLRLVGFDVDDIVLLLQEV